MAENEIRLSKQQRALPVMAQEETRMDPAQPIYPIHHDPIHSTLAGDAEMLELIEMFVSEMPTRVSEMRECLEARNLELLGLMAHKLRGAAGGYGYQVITEAAKGLEQSISSAQDLGKIRRELERLTDLCSRATANTNKN